MPHGKNRHSFNVILTVQQNEDLIKLAAHLHVPRGALLRNLLRAAFEMTFENVPTCATGARCYVPQMHFQPDLKAADKATQGLEP